MSDMITIAMTAARLPISIDLKMLTRHGFICGATGTGKSTGVQRMAEEFSKQGIPVFMADVKGDMSGVAARGGSNKRINDRFTELGIKAAPDKFPVRLWDLYGVHGAHIHTSVHDIGSELMARVLGLNDAQAGALAIAYRKSDDDKAWMLTLDDLRMTLDDMLEDRETVSRRYGHVTSSSINAIQRNILALETMGGFHLFNEPAFDIRDMISTKDGRGIVNLLHADKLMESPRLYGVFLLWLLRELFRTLPEVGDVDKPVFAFFIDEAHLILKDAPKELLATIERLVRLVRSKGVGVYFASQNPADFPDTILAQLGTRIQFCLRAYTPRDQRMVKASAAAFRQNRGVDVKSEITNLGVGEVLISVLDPSGIPSKVEKAFMIPPSAQVGPISDIEREEIMATSDLRSKYGIALTDNQASRAFNNRRRAELGLPEMDDNSGWSEGSYMAYLPSEDNRGRVSAFGARMVYLGRIALWGSFLAGLFMLGRLAL